MPDELVERVAAAVWKAWRGPEELGAAWPDVSERSRRIGRAMALAAIAAMREPSEAMLDAARDWSGAKYGKPIGDDAAIGCWQAMIDEALKEPPPAPAP